MTSNINKKRNMTISLINSLGHKVNELFTINKIIKSNLQYYQILYSNNKEYMSFYFSSLGNKKNTKVDLSIETIITKVNNEIQNIIKKCKKEFSIAKNYHDKYSTKLQNDIEKLNEYLERISEDNFLYENEIKSKENLIKCLTKEKDQLKKNYFEEEKHTYLNYNSYLNTFNVPLNKTTIDKPLINFEEGENTLKSQLENLRRKFALNMRTHNKDTIKNVNLQRKKRTLSDLVTSINYINQTDIGNPGVNMNFFGILNKKIRGVVHNHGYGEEYDDENYENIDENTFIFLPFEMEINKNEINELFETDLTLPFMEAKFIKPKPLFKNITEKKTNKSAVMVPGLNFLQIEYNKEKIDYSYDENGGEESEEEEKETKESKKKNKEDAEIDKKIKYFKEQIKIYKKKNKKLKNLIDDYENFRKKVSPKFKIYEQRMLKENKKENK